MRFGTVCATVVLAALVSASPSSGSTSPTDVRAALDAVVAAGAPGVAATWTDGGRTESYVAGVANLETGRPISLGDHYRIASQTKAWTATVVVMLAREGRLRLSDTVHRWLPGVVPGDRRITVRQLLNMTSGLNEYLGVNGPLVVGSVQQYPDLRWTPGQLVAIGSSTGLMFAPGSDFLYSNTNYALLTLIAERAGGRSLGQLMRTKIFAPLGLRGTTYRPEVNGMRAPFVSGYTITEGSPPEDATFTSPTIAFGAGAVVSTQRDVRRFFRSLIAGKLLPRRWLALMEKPTPQSLASEPDGQYGYGLGIERTQTCGTNYGHAGAFPGYESLTEVTPDARGSFTVSMNASLKIGSSAPFPPAISAAFKQAEDVLRCAMHGA